MKKAPVGGGHSSRPVSMVRFMRETGMRWTQNVRNRVQTYPRIRRGAGLGPRQTGGAVSKYGEAACVWDRRQIWFLHSSPGAELSTDLAPQRTPKVCRSRQVGPSTRIEKWNLYRTETAYRRVRTTLANPGKDEVPEVGVVSTI